MAKDLDFEKSGIGRDRVYEIQCVAKRRGHKAQRFGFRNQASPVFARIFGSAGAENEQGECEY